MAYLYSYKDKNGVSVSVYITPNDRIVEVR